MAIVSLDTAEIPVVIPRVPKEMISISREGNKTKVRMNSSSLSVIQECPRKAQYLLHQKWKAQDESPATLFGSAIHKALEVFYSGDVTERRMVILEELEMVAMGIMPHRPGLLHRAVAAFAEKAQPLAQLPDTDKRSLMNGAWILHHYFKAFIDDPYQALVD